MRVLRNLLFRYSSHIGSLLFFIAQTKILTLFVDKNELGKFFTVVGIVVIITEISKLGFPLLYMRFIPKFEARNEKEKRDSLLSLSFLTYLVVGIFEALIIFFLSFLSPLRKFGGIIPLLPIGFVSYLLYGFFVLEMSAIIAERKMHISSTLSIVHSFFYLALLYLSRKTLKPSLVFELFLIATVPFIFISLFFLKVGWRLSIRNIEKEIKDFELNAIYNSFLDAFLGYADRIILASFIPFDLLAVFVVARRIEKALKQFLWVILEVLSPEVSYYGEKGRPLLFLSRFLNKFFFLIASVCVLIVAVFGEKIILFVSTSGYLKSYPFLLGLLTVSLLSSLFAPNSMIARSVGRMDLFFKENLYKVTGYLLFAIVLSKFIGVWGLVLALMGGALIATLYVAKVVNPKVGVKFPPMGYILVIVFFSFLFYLLSHYLSQAIVIPGILTLFFITYGSLDKGELLFIKTRGKEYEDS